LTTEYITKKIGFTAGSFDLLHPGYIELFKKAKTKCDFLVVGLHSDPSVERPEKIKPLLSIEERLEALSALRFVDSVIVYETEKDLLKIISVLKPHIRFLGDDYREKQYTGKDLVKETYYVDRTHGWSTSKLKKQIYENYKNYLE